MKKKKTLLVIMFIAIILLVVGSSTIINNVLPIKKQEEAKAYNSSQELIGSYEDAEVETAEDSEGNEIKNLEINAYFLDEEGNKKRGIYKTIPTDDYVTLYVDLGLSQDNVSITNARVRLPVCNAAIIPTLSEGGIIKKVNADNDIELNEIVPGNSAHLSFSMSPIVYSASGYTYKANYSRENDAIIEGDYVDEEGNIRHFSKTIKWKLDWNADVKIKDVRFGNMIANKGNLIRLKDNRIVALLEVVSENEVGAIPAAGEYKMSGFKVNGIAPEIIVSPTKMGYNNYIMEDVNYDQASDTLTWRAIEQGAGQGAVVRFTFHSYVTLIYPETLYNNYLKNQTNTIEAQLNLECKNMAYVNPNIQYTEKSLLTPDQYPELGTRYTDKADASMTLQFDNYTGELFSYNTGITGQSKINSELIYYGVNTTAGYKEECNVTVNAGNGIIDSVKIDWTNDNPAEHSFMDNDENYYSHEDFKYYTGIVINQETMTALESDGWIKIYDAETNSLIAEYTQAGRYEYGNKYKKIRIETSKVVNPGHISVSNLVEIDNEALKAKYPTLSQFETFTKLAASSNAYIRLKGDTSYSDPYGAWTKVNYESGRLLLSAGGPYTVDTYETSRINYTAALNVLDYSHQDTYFSITYYKDPKVLVEFPTTVKSNNTKYVEGTLNVISGGKVMEATISNRLTKNGKDYFIISIKGETNNSIAINAAFDVVPQTTKIKNLTDENDRRMRTFANTTYDGTKIIGNIQMSGWNSIGPDTYDWNGNGIYEEENYFYASTNLIFTEPIGVRTVTSLNLDGSEEEVLSPNVMRLDKSQDKGKSVTVNNYLYNYSDGVLKKLKLVGRIPYKGNKFLKSGDNMGSTFDTTMTSGIKIPDELKGKVTIKYSTQEVDIIDSSSVSDIDSKFNWTTNFTSDAKSYMIDFGDTDIDKGNAYNFTYTIKLPDTLNYGLASYTSNAILFNVFEEGKEVFALPVESPKVGLAIESSNIFDIDFIKVDKNDNTKELTGARYKLTRVDGEQIKQGEDWVDFIELGSDTESLLSVSGLYPEVEYKLEETQAPTNYKAQDIIFKIVHNKTSGFIIETLSGELKNQQYVSSDGYRIKYQIKIPEELDVVGYDIQYYYQRDDGTYSTTPNATINGGTTEVGSTITRNDIELDPTKIEGRPTGNYVLDDETIDTTEKTDNEIVIVEDESANIFKVYFKKQYTITYKKGDHGTFDDDVHSGLSYGVKTPDCTKNIAIEHDPGYVFNGWKPTVENTVTKDMTYIAQWVPDPNTKYSIQFYYEVDGNYKSTPDSTENRTGTAFTKAVATSADKTPALGKTGYVFDSAYAGNVLEKDIAADGSTVLKVYFKLNEATYKVEFYYEENGSYPTRPYATVDNRIALTDTNVSLKTPTRVNDFTVTVTDSKVTDEDISRPKTDRNYKYDTEASNKVSANVEGDGSTVLKVYFKEIPVKYDLDVVLKNTADKTLTNNSFTITRQKASETQNVIWNSKAVTDNIEIEERGAIIDTYTYRITENEAPNLKYVNVLNGKFVQVTVAISDEGKASVTEWGVYDSNGKVAETDEVYSYVRAPVVSSANGIDKIFVKIINPVRYTVEVKKLDTAEDPKAIPDTEFTIKSEVIGSQNAAHSGEIVTESKDGLTMSESGEVNGLTNDRGCIRYEETWVDADEYTYEIVENRAAGNQMVNILEGYKVVVKVKVSADGLLEVVKQNGRNFAIVATEPGKVVTDDLYSYVNVVAENNSLNAIINTTGKLNIDIDNPVRFNLDIDKRDSAGNVIDNAKFTISRRDLDDPLFDNKSANGDVEVVEDPIKVGTYEYYIYENQASSEKYENILKNRYIKLILDVKGNGHVDIVEQNGKAFKVYDKLGAEITDQENVLNFIEVWPEIAETGDKAGITTIKVKVTNPVRYFVNVTTATTAYAEDKNIDEYFLDKTDVMVNRNETNIYSAQPTKDIEVVETPITAGEYEYYFTQTTTKSNKFVNPLENKFVKVTVAVSPNGTLNITKTEFFEGTIGDEHNKRLTNDDAEKYVKVSVSNPNNAESMLNILIIDPVRFSVEVKKVDTDNKPIEDTQISINSGVVDEQNAAHKDEVIESAESKDGIGVTADGIVAGTTNNEGVIKFEETWVESNESGKLSDENRAFYTYEITEIEPAGNQYVNVLEGYKVIVRVKVEPNGNVKLVDKNGAEYGKNAKYKYTIVKIADGSEVSTTDVAYKYVAVDVESNSVNAIIKGTDELKVNVTNPVRFDFDINKKSTDGLPLAGTKFTVTREGKDTPIFEGEPNEEIEIREDPIDSGTYTYLIRENNTNKTVGNRYVNVLEGKYIKLRAKVNANGIIDIVDNNNKTDNNDYFEVYEESGKQVTDNNVLRYISVSSTDLDGDGVYKLDVNVTNPVRYEIDIITKDTLNQFLNGVNVSLYKVVGEENKNLYTDDAIEEVEKLEIPADAGTYTYYVKENSAPTERYINVLNNKYIEIKLTVAPNGMLTETHKLYEGEIGKGKEVTTGEVLERYSVVADNNGDVSRLNVTITNPVRFIVEIDKYDTADAPLIDTTFEIESPIIENQAYEHNNEKINGIDDDGITADGVVTGKTDNAIEKSKDGNMQRARISYEETWVDANDGKGYYTYYIRETKTAGAQYVNMLEGHKVVVRARVGADGTLTLVDKNGNAYAKDAKYKFTIETEDGQEIAINDETIESKYKYVNIEASNNKILATMNASVINPVRYNIAVYETIYGDEKVKLNNIPIEIQSEFSGSTTLVTAGEGENAGYATMEERAVWADTYEYRIFQLNKFNGNNVEGEFVNMLDGYYIGIDLYVPGNGDIKTISKDGDYTTVSYKLYKKTASGEYAEIDFNDTIVDDFVKVKITKDENNVCTLNIYIITPEKYNFRLEKTDIDVLYSVNTYPDKYPEVSPNMNDVEFTITIKDANGEIVLKDTKSGKDAKSEFATINTKSGLTKNVKGVDGILDFNNILIERTGTYTFEIEEVTPKVEGMIYKDKSEPIILTADIVVKNGKYVLENMTTKQAERYTIKENTKLSGKQTQTVNVNVTNERIKGKYDLDLNKVNKFTGLPLDGAVYKVTVEQEGKEEKVLYLSNDDVLSMEQLIAYEEEESTSVNGTTSFKDIRIELPETYTIKIEEVKAPVIETEDGKMITFTKLDDVIELEVTTVIEGEYDDAHYVLGDIKLKEGNHDLISEEHSAKEEEKQNIQLRIENEYFDLALRQYVVDVNGTKFDRKLEVNTDKLQSNEATDAEYVLNKEPQRAYAGQEVIYAIEVFNEGIIDGYAEEIMQYLPEGLEFVDDEFNKSFGWELNEDNTGVVTHALSKKTNEKENLIPAYIKDVKEDSEENEENKEDENNKGEAGDNNNEADNNNSEGNKEDRLSSKVIYLKLKVKEDVKLKSILTTIAEVTKYQANERKESVDRDSYDLVTLPKGEDLVEYEENQEDDDDYEKLIIEEFDLAPVKYAKSVNGEEQKERAPVEQLDETRADEYRQGIFNGFKYKNENEMLRLDQNDKIIYGIQVRNEGSVGSYATEVMDTIPSGLKFDKDSEINKKYEWKLLDAEKNPTEDVEKAAYVVTDYLSEAKGKVDEETGVNSNWLAPVTLKGSELTIDYKELEVEFIVTEPTSEDRIVKNIATISKFIDDLGINVEDRDPEERRPDNVEKIYVNIFDLELEQVINSVEVTNTKTNEVTMMDGEEIRKLAKVDIAKSKLKNTNVKVEYKITIKNNGESAGYVTELKDYIPEGFIFDANDNANWIASDGYATTEALSNELLNPGDTREVTLVLRWNGAAKVGVKENLSEISKHADKNKLDIVDWDSTPDNKVLEEDDIDYTTIILTVKTGSAEIAVMSVAVVFMIVTSLGITAYNRRKIK